MELISQKARDLVREYAAADANELAVKRLTPDAILPTKGSVQAAGYDLYSVADVTIEPMSNAKIPTGLAITVPENTYGHISARSGLAWNHQVSVGGGVVDRDYTGHVEVILFNHSQKQVRIGKGDRVAQLVLECIRHAEIVEVMDLNPTARGAQGFGSTGV